VTSVRRRPRSALLAVAAAAATVVAVGDVPAASAVTGSPATPLADPDTVPVADGTYATYGSTVRDVDASGAPQPGRRWRVPVIRHGRGATLGFGGAPIAADAMPTVPAWIDAAADIWAPSVVFYDGRYQMFYAYRRADNGQACIGWAESASPAGPFGNHRGWACPGGERWAIDPDAFVDSADGGLYVTFRDDAAITAAHTPNWRRETALAVVQVDPSGRPFWSTRRTLLLSTDVRYDGPTGSGVWVIENPSFVHTTSSRGTGWHVFFSAHEWNSDSYSVGVAYCGPTPRPDTTITASGRCNLVGGGTRPYFGHSASGADPRWPVPPDDPMGPGGFSFFTMHGGSDRQRVVWHVWVGESQPPHLRREANIGVFEGTPTQLILR
jgi:hypothetical protein